jgi:hypothetical protein
MQSLSGLHAAVTRRTREENGSVQTPSRTQFSRRLEPRPKIAPPHATATLGRRETRPNQDDARSLPDMPPPQLVPQKRSARPLGDETPRSVLTPNSRNRFQDSGLAGDEDQRGRLTVESSGKRHKWIEDIVGVRLSPRIVIADIVESEHRGHAILTIRLPNSHNLQGSAPPSCKRLKSPKGQQSLL